MEDEQELDRKDFEAWWNNEGSEPPPPLLDKEQQIYHKCREAWLNGAFKASMRGEEIAYKNYLAERRKEKI